MSDSVNLQEQFVVSQTENTPEQIPPAKTRFNGVKQLLQRLQSAWSVSTGKKRFVFLLVPVGVSLLIVLAVHFLIPSFKILSPNVSRNFKLTDDGHWERLKIPDRESPFFTLAPVTPQVYGISATEKLQLKTTEDIPESFIRENLESSSPVVLTKKATSSYEITPAKALGIDEALSVTLKVKDKTSGGHTFDRDYSWAFQTPPKFKVLSTLPDNKHTEVPVNTGIEIKFNLDSYDNPKPFIVMSPSFEYRTEVHGQTFSIIPLQPLSAKSEYTVTLRKGLSTNSHTDLLVDDYTFSFQTAETNISKASMSLSDNLVEVAPDNPLLVKVHATNWDDQEIKAAVYKFPSVSVFLDSRKKIDEILSGWRRYYPEVNQVNTNALSKVSESSVKILEQDQLSYLNLPQKLSPGFYLVKLSYNNDSSLEQLWLQVTNVAGYVSVGKEQTVVWANNINGGATKQALVSLYGSTNTYSTNDQGWTSFTTPQNFVDNNAHYITVSSQDGDQIALPVKSLSGEKSGSTTSSDYWSYLYNERQLYKPGDTVYFWGVAKKHGTNEVPSNVDVSISQGYYWDGAQLDDVLKTPVTPNADGSYIGKIKLTNVNSGYVSLIAKVNGVTIANSSFQVSEFVKPQMKIDVTANKKAIFVGEPVDFGIAASFFDGTPVSNISLNLRSGGYYSSANETPIALDQSGTAHYSYTPTIDSSNQYPRYEGISVLPKSAQEGESSGDGSVYVYGSRLQIEANASQIGNKGNLDATVYNLNLDKFNSGVSSSVRDGVAANQKTHIVVTKTWYEQKQSGTYYDYVEKVTRPKYDYIRHDEKINDSDMYTNSDGKINYQLNLEQQKSYQITLSTIDRDGHSTSASQYFYYYMDSGSNDQTAAIDLSIDREKNIYSLGEQVNVRLTKNNVDVADTDSNRFLFITANRGRQTISETDAPHFEFTFNEENVPNVYVGAIVFNKDHYEPVNATCKNNWVCAGYDYYNPFAFSAMLVKYKQDDSKLALSITSDKATYGPGDQAQVSVTVTKNGVTVPNATVQIVLVDQALAAMGAVNKPDILNSLYKTVPSFIYYNYYSHRPLFPDVPGAERGGGGGDRITFKDTAYFDTQVTDSTGKAVFAVKLPDNITTWLTYAQAITGATDAGQTESSLIATKEFFVTSAFPNTILSRDLAEVGVNAFGKILSKNSKIPTDVVFSRDNTELSTAHLDITANQDSFVQIPKLDLGSYLLSVRGSYQSVSDGLGLPLNVISSRISLNNEVQTKLKSGESMRGIDKNIQFRTDMPVKLIVSDAGKGKYFSQLYSYCWEQSNRVEKKLAKVSASKLLLDSFDESDCKDTTDFSVYQAGDGGVRQVDWGGSDLETSVWTVYTDPNLLDKTKLSRYFQNYLNNGYSDRRSRLLAAWGLTLLGNSKVNDIRILTNGAQSFNEKVIGALALYSAGMKEESRNMYLDLLANYAYTNKPYVRIQSDKTDMDVYLQDTTMALLLGELVQKDYDEGMHAYLRDYRTVGKNIVIDLADIAFIKDVLAGLPTQNTSVSYQSPSETIKKTLKGGSFTVDLKPKDTTAFNLTVQDGAAEVTTSYFVDPATFGSLATDNRLKLERTYQKVTGQGDQIKPGDIVSVTLHYIVSTDAPIGCIKVNDYIPSGFSYLPNPGIYGLNDTYLGYMYEENPHVIGGCVYNSAWWGTYGHNTMGYYMRAITSGTYVAEPATIQSVTERSVFQKTSEENITISQ